ncbi:MAG: N-acetylmuramoyl-L-alanine amidase [Phycisphaerales bacterium]
MPGKVTSPFGRLLLAGLLALLGGCSTSRGDAGRAAGHIVVAGERHPVAAPVVLWTDPGGYNAHALTNRFDEDPGEPRQRYGPRQPRTPAIKRIVQRDGWTPRAVRAQVDQFVLHYDVAGTSRSCFRVLHDVRGLSVHFLLDIDGTIYQTLDVTHRAWHATKANDRSVGIEIANIGAYPPDDRETLDRWYREEPGGAVLTLPGWLGDGGVRTPGFVARPSRPSAVRGTVHGRAYEMYDLTNEQYESLIALTTALCRALPGLEPIAPRDASGRVRTGVLSDAEFESFGGVLGHLHVQSNKIDPGPAFDWERVMRGVRQDLGRESEAVLR